MWMDDLCVHLLGSDHDLIISAPVMTFHVKIHNFVIIELPRHRCLKTTVHIHIHTPHSFKKLTRL